VEAPLLNGEHLLNMLHTIHFVLPSPAALPVSSDTEDMLPYTPPGHCLSYYACALAVLLVGEVGILAMWLEGGMGWRGLLGDGRLTTSAFCNSPPDLLCVFHITTLALFLFPILATQAGSWGVWEFISMYSM
jgi:hypothetical protein